ncbi:hypothetical protein [Carnimonas nigrificans]|nr:hypothetical protein [Carnimonas nigrificans]
MGPHKIIYLVAAIVIIGVIGFFIFHFSSTPVNEQPTQERSQDVQESNFQ